MSKSLSYAYAAKLLGSSDSKLIRAIDVATGGLLLSATAAGSGLALGLYGVKADFVALCAKLLTNLNAKKEGFSRFDRTERLAAAHTVIVIASYFDALAKVEKELLVQPSEPPSRYIPAGDDDNGQVPREVQILVKKALDSRPAKSQQVALASGDPSAYKAPFSAADILQVDIPAPVPQRPYEDTLVELKKLFVEWARAHPELVVGPELWSSAPDKTRKDLRNLLVARVPDRAVRRYEELFRQLASEFQEVAFWANLIDQQAIRTEIRRLATGLAGLEHGLNQIASGRMPDSRRTDLARFYQDALQRPIADTGEGPADGLCIPLLGDSYINPDFRVSDVARRNRPDLEPWWEKFPVRTDIQEFLIGYLTSSQAIDRTLLVLGQPGSGKSVLTKVLSACLPARDFLAVRVVLRDVPADADIQAQIEHAIREATGYNISWPDLTLTAGDALPVIIFDGFDELLQATGVSQSDYLEKLVIFQKREAVQKRPMAVIVTSRTAVADRARVPSEGFTCIRLEPFRNEQVSRWLAIWNSSNASVLAERSLAPLTSAALTAYTDLSAQPLLLLMLALYHADGNVLQQADEELSHADLYEQLLSSFARREIRKARPDLDEYTYRAQIEDELFRLSVAALAMFNRARQWATESELDADLAALVRSNLRPTQGTGFRQPLSQAQLIIGRFFFVHQAQAVREGVQLTASEFLHATFGEFLVARLVEREMSSLARMAQASPDRARYAAPDEDFLYSIISFEPLSARMTILDFIGDLVGKASEEHRQSLRTLLISLFRTAFGQRLEGKFRDYEPVLRTVPGRLAMYSANLLLLIVTTSAHATASELFPDSDDPVDSWRRCALLWRSQLPPQGWSWLASLELRRTGIAGDRDVTVSLRSDSQGDVTVSVDPLWTSDQAPSEADRPTSWSTYDYPRLQVESRFLCDPAEDIVAHSMTAFSEAQLASLVTTFVRWPDGRSMSAAYALIKLWITTTEGVRIDLLTTSFDHCFDIALYASSSLDLETRELYRKIVLDQLSTRLHRLPGAWRQKARETLEDARSNPGCAAFAERAIVKLGFRISRSLDRHT